LPDAGIFMTWPKKLPAKTISAPDLGGTQGFAQKGNREENRCDGVRYEYRMVRMGPMFWIRASRRNKPENSREGHIKNADPANQRQAAQPGLFVRQERQKTGCFR